MATTPMKYPSSVFDGRERIVGTTNYWTYLANVVNNPIWSGAVEGASTTGHVGSTIYITNVRWSDSINGKGYEFTIPPNARIDGILAEILRSGAYAKDVAVSVSIPGGALANRAKNRQRSDNNLMVDTYGGSSDKWGSSILTPQIINSDDFGLRLAILRTVSGGGTYACFVMGLQVTYTDPTYVITNDLPSQVLLGSRITNKITITSSNGIDQGEEIPLTVPIPQGFTLVSSSSNEGIYNESTHTWTPILNSSTKKATLTLVLQATSSVSNQTETITETTYNTTLNNTYSVVTSDPGNIFYWESVINDAKTIKNLIDGEDYTISVTNKYTDPGVTGIFDGIKNNRISVLTYVDNLVSANVATGTNTLATIGGYINWGTTLESSTEWAVNGWNRSLKVICPGTIVKM